MSADPGKTNPGGTPPAADLLGKVLRGKNTEARMRTLINGHWEMVSRCNTIEEVRTLLDRERELTEQYVQGVIEGSPTGHEQAKTA